MAYFFAQSDSRILKKTMTFYFTKAADKPVYVNIVVYGYVLNYEF